LRPRRPLDLAKLRLLEENLKTLTHPYESI
jgi:hypothetical protein